MLTDIDYRHSAIHSVNRHCGHIHWAVTCRTYRCIDLTVATSDVHSTDGIWGNLLVIFNAEAPPLLGNARGHQSLSAGEDVLA